MTKNQWQVRIGLEVHIQLKTPQKLFCGCSTAFCSEPNTAVCPVCLGLPGALPVFNQSVMKPAVKLAQVLQFEKICPAIRFFRKSYFYPDQPKGFQITQQEAPLGMNGRLDFRQSGEIKTIGIRQLHIEEDAGKLVHRDDGTSCIDFNRSGHPLLELVTEPGFDSPDSAAAFLTEVRELVRDLEISRGRMEEGNLRCDANVSLGSAELSDRDSRVEIKNLNSFRHLRNALAFEIKRQQQVIESDGKLHSETRRWSEKDHKTHCTRRKEGAPDYRIMAEPDLPVIPVDSSQIKVPESLIPSTPAARYQQLVRNVDIQKQHANLICRSRVLTELTIKWAGKIHTRHLIPFVIGPVRSVLQANHSASLWFKNLDIPDADMILSVWSKGLIDVSGINDLISGKTEVQSVRRAAHRIDGRDCVSDELIRDTLRSLTRKFPDEWNRLLGGNLQLEHFFTGQVLKKLTFPADPQRVREIIRIYRSKIIQNPKPEN